MICNHRNNIFRCDDFIFIRRNNILERLLGKLQGYFFFLQFGTCHNSVKSTFKFTNIGFYIICDVFNDIFINIVAVHIFFFMEDGHSCLIVRQCNIRNQTPFEPGTETFFQNLHILWRLIRRYDDLFFRTVKAVKSVEKFLLGRFFSNNKLNIIDQKDINITVFFTEFGHC